MSFAVFMILWVAALLALFTAGAVSWSKRHPASAAPAVLVPAIPAAEPKTPRDTSRPYPRPKGHRSKLNRVCPVCGTGSETGDLDRRLFGWQAHGSCVEWLGDWHPSRREVHHGSTNTIHYNGNGTSGFAGGSWGSGGVSISVVASPGAQVNVGDHNTAMLANGLATVDEMRARVLSAFSVPPAQVSDSAHLRHLEALQEMFLGNETVAWSAAGDRQPCQCFACGTDPKCPHGVNRQKGFEIG